MFLIITVVIVYGQMLGHDFVYFDDNRYVAENTRVKAGLTADNIKWAFSTLHLEFWHPLTWLSLMLDTQLFGVNPGGYLFTNLLLHIFNSLLLFIFFNRATGSVWQSGLVAALFALHPMHVESVAWIAQRKDVLSSFFWMLTMLAYLLFVERPGFKAYLAVLLSLIFGLMAKSMLITLPFVLILMDYWPLGRLRYEASAKAFFLSLLSHLREKVPLIVVCGAASVLTYIAQQSGGGIKSAAAVSLADRISNALISYVAYLAKMLWPFKLACFYPFPDSFWLWRVGGALLLLLLITGLAIRSVRRYPFLIVGWLWYLGTLLPVIGLVKIGAFSMADRYSYVPLIGIFIISIWGVPELVAGINYRKAVMACLATLALAICLLTARNQVRFWQDGSSLFTHAQKVTSDNWFAHIALGRDLLRREKFDEAAEQFFETLRLKPNYIPTYINLGLTYARQNKIAEAIAYMSEAERMNANLVDVQESLGILYLQQGDLDKANRHFNKALEIEPNNATVHKYLGNMMVDKGDLDAAIDHYAASLRIQPGDARVHYNLGLALEKQDKNEKATEQYLATLKMEPDNADAHYNLANLRVKQNKLDAAAEHYQKALTIKPDLIQALSNLAYVYASKKEYDRSISILVKSAKLQPDNPGIYYNIACLYAMQNKKAESIQWLETAFKKGYKNCRLARTDNDLHRVRTAAGYNEIMDRYCP
ncbi:MAG: tetratricopeptide repeat protein [Deltaproteobacteria bacterium]|nr:tetratricopeptide repeat protein [Deltaproteobacteria bacterium]